MRILNPCWKVFFLWKVANFRTGRVPEAWSAWKDPTLERSFSLWFAIYRFVNVTHREQNHSYSRKRENIYNYSFWWQTRQNQKRHRYFGAARESLDNLGQKLGLTRNTKKSHLLPLRFTCIHSPLGEKLRTNSFFIDTSLSKSCLQEYTNTLFTQQ